MEEEIYIILILLYAGIMPTLGLFFGSWLYYEKEWPKRFCEWIDKKLNIKY